MKLPSILVVDDDELSRELLVRTLSHGEMEVIAVASGTEAINKVMEGGIQLLLLDFFMPEMDGAEVCRRIRGFPDPSIAATPIIMLTGFSGDDQEIRCLKAGADDFVTKPVNAAVLRARIDTHLRLSELRRQLEDQNERLEAWQVEMERDLEAARLTQETILPQHEPRMPGWQLETVYEPVIQVGGDLYDWAVKRQGIVHFWISDATGHGASAALMTAMAKSLFRAALEDCDKPSDILYHVNQAFLSVFRGRFLLTAMCARLDVHSGSLALAGGGHPPAYIIRANRELRRMDSQWPPLGIAPYEPGVSTVETLSEGDRFVLLTDGIFGMQRPDGSRVALEEFEQILREAPPSEDWINQLIDLVRASWNSETDWPDDLTIMTGLRLLERL